MIVRENVPLASLTTFRIGGTADLYIEAEDEEDVRAAEGEARSRALPLIPLGGGSNVLVPDEGVRACVLRFVADEVSFSDEGGKVFARAAAGVSWDELAARAAHEGYWGIENLSGIPGTVGGAVVQNIGAYGAALSDVLVSADAFDTHGDAVRTFTNEECAFGYRMSAFKREPGRFIVLSAVLALSREPKPNLSYRDLAERFAGVPEPTLNDIRAAVLSIRAEKFPDLARYGTGGSFFLNQVVSPEEAETLKARFPGLPPLFALPEGGVKVPVAWFLDHRNGVLDLREARVGGAFLWPRQPLVLTAEPGTTFADVDALAREVAKRMRDATGIELAREVITFGAMRA
jgi:UDP-N-acetylmuramate dehydrogenase